MEPEMKSAVRVFPKDSVNQPAVRNTHWTVEVALPISKLMERNPLARMPADGVFWRVNFSRVQWGVVTTADGSGYEKRPCCQSCATQGSPAEDNWVWSKQGAVAMHLPEVGEQLYYFDRALDFVCLTFFCRVFRDGA